MAREGSLGADRLTHTTTTVTLAAHAHRGLIITVYTRFFSFKNPMTCTYTAQIQHIVGKRSDQFNLSLEFRAYLE